MLYEKHILPFIESAKAELQWQKLLSTTVRIKNEIVAKAHHAAYFIHTKSTNLYIVVSTEYQKKLAPAIESSLRTIARGIKNLLKKDNTYITEDMIVLGLKYTVLGLIGTFVCVCVCVVPKLPIA
jgi:hypothetical protein